MTSPKPLIGCTTYVKNIALKRPYDLIGAPASYIRALTAAGGIPVLIPLGLSEEDLMALFGRLDGLLLPGGGDIQPELYGGRRHVKMFSIEPERDRSEIFLARAAASQHKPMLAICRGIQVLNVALGGTLWEDIPSLLPEALPHHTPDDLPRNHPLHTAAIAPGSLLERQLGRRETWVNSLHHQSVRDLAPELTITGTAPDGVVEAVELPGHPYALGVQWHPEVLIDDDPAMLCLFTGLVEAAAA
ncbi:MAG: gamma-glutamyl-gamma-aminobutyrate hydrolase family protein [Candidatus Promineifilaceae bacterium]